MKDSSIRYIFPTGELNYLVMIKLRRDHEAYNSRPIERQNCAYMIGYENTNTINPNKAGHIISHLTNNDDLAVQFIKQFICVELANITQDFPLQQSDYVIALYGTKICIAKIIAMYYEGYGNHFYSQNAVTQIEDLSYISLQCSQNIIYHINLNGVIIGYSSLILTGVARSIFNYFNCYTIKNSIINMIQ
ncbi:hypothetical protein GLOIN_2v1778388 [Rhizophagus irregularis DAOM 181602=DAOM 197198]|uniref:Uncharacterized protein n=1 Tax=Rhizophagus irregularis (strain DAOM 181602 / DAOM 197198 / MUCL 43194) TaxID=747089 RepID=A0A2P4PS99_RHIID|nr:hypothetical protein GLOIN_2v1778388 [Rhizophagus irregularis DAOM 181602=DAOM 197198]POG68265.1 hypothetical protein GLOIN_2v1778388 [Rhizophagus irregularis DAOM 181602=DAOM 197198]|eukprot:XP_025175131.1 hypothetical protein GLOIN_2v1778388 [Rhizophagus irregularis DAOM 181602=DAOM 197198]